MRLKKIAYSGNYLLLVLIILGILGIINFFGNSYFKRWDLTEQKLFTISDATRKILKGLDDVVSIKAYFSKDLPPYVIPLQQQVKDMLDEYQAYAGNKLSIEFQDPSEDPELERQVQQMGIPRVQLNIIEKDQAQVKNVFLGIAIYYEDKKEVIPVIQDTTTLEYELTAAIKRVLSSEIKTVGWFDPTDDMSVARKYQVVQRLLGKEYELRPVKSLDKQAVPAEVQNLIISSSTEFSDRAKYEIDQFLMRGGKLFLLLNTIELKQNSLELDSSKNSNLNDLLSHYGIKLNKALVLDKVNAHASFSQGFMSFSMPYPFWVKIPQKGFANHPALKRLDGVVFPWTSPLEIIEKEGVESTVLASSSPYSWKKNAERFINLAPQQRFNPPNKLESYPLAVLLNGEFESFYKGKEVPKRGEEEKKDEKADTEEKQLQAADTEKETALTKSPTTQIIVVGNSRFLEDNFLRMFRNNQFFFLNMVDWLNVGNDLIKIRSRQLDERPLEEISEQQKSYIRFFNTFGVSILLIAFGLIRYKLKRRTQQIYESSFAGSSH